MNDKEYTCFFCMERKATRMLSGVKWPKPIPEKMVIVCCDECAELPAEEMAMHILDYARCLRIATN